MKTRACALVTFGAHSCRLAQWQNVSTRSRCRGALGAYQAGVYKGIAETGFNRFSAATAATFGVPGFFVPRQPPASLAPDGTAESAECLRHLAAQGDGARTLTWIFSIERAYGFLPSRPAMSIEGVGIVPSVFTLSLHRCLDTMHLFYPSLCIVVAIVLMKEQTWTFFIHGGF
jgi:hypothetical protein